MIEKGTIIYEGKPFAYVLNKEHRTTRCDHCLKSGQLQKCSNCQYVYYCNRECQKGSWKVHKPECKNLQKYYNETKKEVENIVWLMARVILKLSKGGNSEKDFYTETGFRKFEDLMSHADDIRKDARRWPFFLMVCKDLERLFPESVKLKTQELLAIYGKLEINNFTLTNLDESVNLGIGLYLGASIIDHSCDPTVISVTHGTTIKILTIVSLPTLDWSKIRCRYTDKYLHYTKGRRQDLLERYYFWCDCQKCCTPDPLAACPNIDCSSNCDPNDEKCIGCGEIFPESYKEKFDKVVKLTTQCLDSDKRKDATTIKSCWMEQIGILHPHNWYHLRTLKFVVDATSANNYEQLEFYVTRLIEGYVKHYGDYNPILLKYYFLLGCTQFQLKKYIECLKILTDLQSMITVIYEKETSFTNKEQLDALVENIKSIQENI